MTATIPVIERASTRNAGRRIEPTPSETITRAVTMMCSPEVARDAWRESEFQPDAKPDATFTAAPGGHGTIVTVSIAEADVKDGLASDTSRKADPADAVADALRRFKARVETGEIPTTDGQPTGRRS